MTSQQNWGMFWFDRISGLMFGLLFLSMFFMLWTRLPVMLLEAYSNGEWAYLGGLLPIVILIGVITVITLIYTAGWVWKGHDWIDPYFESGSKKTNKEEA